MLDTNKPGVGLSKPPLSLCEKNLSLQISVAWMIVIFVSLVYEISDIFALYRGMKCSYSILISSFGQLSVNIINYFGKWLFLLMNRFNSLKTILTIYLNLSALLFRLELSEKYDEKYLSDEPTPTSFFEHPALL